MTRMWDTLVASGTSCAGPGHQVRDPRLALHRPTRYEPTQHWAFAGALSARRGRCGDCHCHTVVAEQDARGGADTACRPSSFYGAARRCATWVHKSRANSPNGRRCRSVIIEDAEPAHRPGLQRAAQGDEGAQRPDDVAALRAHRRGRPGHHPLPLPTGHPHHARWPPTSQPCLPHQTRHSPRTPRAPARALGRARALARDEATPDPAQRDGPVAASLGSAMNAASNLHRTSAQHPGERPSSTAPYGVEGPGKRQGVRTVPAGTTKAETDQAPGAGLWTE